MTMNKYMLSLQREAEELRAENALLREERDDALWQLRRLEERTDADAEEIARLKMSVQRFSQVQGR